MLTFSRYVRFNGCVLQRDKGGSSTVTWSDNSTAESFDRLLVKFFNVGQNGVLCLISSCREFQNLF